MNEPLDNLNLRFDYAALNSEVTEADVRRTCAEAIQCELCAVCFNPVWIRIASEIVAGTGVRVISVAGFPLGANRTSQKVIEAAEAVQDGADEIDMVANIGWLCSDRFVEAEAEMRKVRRNLPEDVVLKVIIEAGKLTSAQQVDATSAVINSGAQFVKTSTGFFGGATIEQVEILHRAARGQIQVKASGGIRTLDQCREFLKAGAARLGSSSCVNILNELRRTRA